MLWYGHVSGLTSLTMAMGAVGVGALSGRVGLLGVLVVSGLALAASVCFGGLACGIAKEVSFALFICPFSFWPVRAVQVFHSARACVHPRSGI